MTGGVFEAAWTLLYFTIGVSLQITELLSPLWSWRRVQGKMGGGTSKTTTLPEDVEQGEAGGTKSGKEEGKSKPKSKSKSKPESKPESKDKKDSKKKKGGKKGKKEEEPPPPDPMEALEAGDK